MTSNLRLTYADAAFCLDNNQPPRRSRPWSRHLSARTLFLAFCTAVCLVEPALSFEMKIGALIEFTGPLSEIGPPIEKAARLAVKVANKAAEDAGVAINVTLASADSQGDPQAALSAARTLVDKGISCLLGPATTPEAIVVLNNVTMQRNITMWPQASSARLRTVMDNRTIFRTVPADNMQSRALVTAIQWRGFGKARVALIYRNEPYGESLSKAFAKDWQAAGGAILTTVSFDPQQANFDSEAAQAVGATPDAYVVIDYPDTFARLAAALVRTGQFDPTKLFVSDSLSFPNIPKNIPAAALEGAFGVVAGAPKGTSAYARFDQLWREDGGAANTPYAANAFDAGILCFLAAAAAHSPNPSAIREQIRSVTAADAPRFTIENLAAAVEAVSHGRQIDYIGVSGQFRFAPNGDPTSGLYDVFQYRDGARLTVDQIDVTSEP